MGDIQISSEKSSHLQETIKPSSPTPPHLKTHNLSLLDRFAPDMHTPMVFFYPNYKKSDINTLKESLAKCLTQYYPFAGRIPTPPEPYINCNDEGVTFIEAFIDGKLDDFIHKNWQDDTIDQLFPYGLSCTARSGCPNLLDIQLNHFVGGGAAIALSISHKLADGTTITSFINHWATITRNGLPINPRYISSSINNDIKVPGLIFQESGKEDFAIRKFVFPNSKLNELKEKVIGMDKVPTNPSRVEVLLSFIFKHAVSAATMKSGSLQPSNLSVAVNIRKKFVEKYPDETVSNLFTLAIAQMADCTEIKLNEVIAEVRKRKDELEGIRNEEEVVEKLQKTFSTLHGKMYYNSSLCRIPVYEVDFGWGKPVEVQLRIPNSANSGGDNAIILMDTPSGDGIVAFVLLPREELAILLKDEEFLTYVE